MASGSGVGLLLTGAGKRYDVVGAFAAHAFTIAADPSPLAPARYAAQLAVAPPAIEDPDYLPFLRELVERHRVGAIVPLTELDVELLASAPELPALVPEPAIATAVYDKWEAHLLLERLGLPSPPTWLPEQEPDSYPVMIKPRRGSSARSIHAAADARERDFFVSYVKEPVMVQRLLGGPELSVDALCDREGRCLNAIPRTMIESRGGESIKGTVIRDGELIELARAVGETLPMRGPYTMQAFRDPELGLRITDINPRFGGAFPAPMYGARPGRSYPELIVRMAAGERVEPHIGDYASGATFTRFFWQLELDEDLAPTGREIVPGGMPPPRRP